MNIIILLWDQKINKNTYNKNSNDDSNDNIIDDNNSSHNSGNNDYDSQSACKFRDIKYVKY